MKRKRKKWKLEDEIFLASNYNKMSAKELGEKFNKTPNQIHAKIGHLKNKGLIGDAEYLAEREKREKESKANNLSEGLDLSKLKLDKQKKYKISIRKNSKKKYEPFFEGTMIQECKTHVTFRHRLGYRESFLKADFLTGEYKIEEV